MARMRGKFPTAALAVLEAELSGWRELDFGGCHLDRFVRPKDLPGSTDRRL
jgi:phosphohistidine phosphatase